ncbi:MAG: hypothetical protein H8M99_08760 [Gloeobacteraceae cyanobacterium ES-bin-144]|nr:hypothetical protein [Verrucomicrobiales bacterium]
MNFNQGELDLSGNGSDEGYRKWLLELDEKKRAFEVRYGVMVGRRVRVQLRGELNFLEGMIHVVSEKTDASVTKLKLRMGRREFTPSQIESIVRIGDVGEQ